ncbi:Bax inhibitor-1/YccA family protein [Alteromonas macleodii]|jgi:modulator of FtsH protease|uniref:Membrane protein n=6 Tax=Alteromonas TaxID=226 RepID=A0A0B3XTJ6_9ALTE|nr:MULTISPECIES: Bax inhibitor-1/YccA family protein [Alteromonas]APD86394.1 BAX inhibitor protein [Alteromonas sp. Mex14]MCG8496330.1 Bax inhibitor-1/YccA family protein [Enterobacterales bacterium]MDY6976652.1 Bax inhibitor-1/YccA family protein [Pseudomonadota bacterium]NKX32827.1 Bax inhibitor-1/YccA family protein [Alteromonadaceae bacterium A_SAG1]PTU01896.1 BAX inhibitor (BI)-1/YccA family protein [Pseudomonas sp. HMWF031]GFD70653.1 BAX inhibitor protein [Tenacibaculum sp. KUL113]GFD9|tara:strand:+ start:263 stop:928 length:666 start_codon:yes stop_codon:yes gene_type:complete
MDQRSMYSSASQPSVLQTNKVLRNTYMLLAMTLAFSAVCAGIAMAVGISPMMSLVMTIGAFITLFVVQKKADSASGIYWVFAFTGLMGASLGYTLNFYLGVAGPGLIMEALGATALVFFALSGYALTTKKDFSFMGGFLVVGLVVVLVAAIANIFFAVPAVSLAISAAIVFIMSGFILFDTSRIIHGGETNYIRATVSLYLNIYNLFTSILHLLGAFGGDD